MLAFIEKRCMLKFLYSAGVTHVLNIEYRLKNHFDVIF